MTWLIGKSGYSLLDPSTIIHFAFWVFVASNVYHLRLHRGWALFFFLLVAGGWEVFERFAEKNWPHVWLRPESWWNSWVGDMVVVPLACWFVWAIFDRYW